MLYELINPCDPYTFIAENRETAALAVFLLTTIYGAETSEAEDADVPVFFIWGAREWYKENFRRTPDEGLDALWPEVCDALESFVYGNPEERKLYEYTLSLIESEGSKEKYKRRWHDRRDSMTDIGQAAWDTARLLREKRGEEHDGQDPDA